MATKSDKKILITGCPRSGTSYISKVLTQYGLDIGHEEEGEGGVVSWYLAPTLPDESKIRIKKNFKLAFNPITQIQHKMVRPYKWTVPFPTQSYKNNFICLHQIRHPLKTISSLPKIFRRSFVWANPFINHTIEDTQLTRNMKMWYYWNLMAEDCSVMSYRIEDLNSKNQDVLSRFCENVGIQKIDEFKAHLSSISKKTNKRNRRKQITKDIMYKADAELTEKIIELANRYGYHNL